MAFTSGNTTAPLFFGKLEETLRSYRASTTYRDLKVHDGALYFETLNLLLHTLIGAVFDGAVFD